MDTSFHIYTGSDVSISHYEKGVFVDVKILYLIAQFFNVALHFEIKS